MDSPSAGSPLARPRRRLPKLTTRRLALGAVVLSPLVLASCQLPTFGGYRGATKQAVDANKLWQGFFITGLCVFILVAFLILWAVLRYRRRSDKIPAQTQYHTLFEIIYTVVPIVMVLVLFYFSVVTENSVDAVPASNVQVNVTAFQWGWRFSYPGHNVTVIGQELQNPTMVVPVGENVHIVLRSSDVIHGFYVPEFNFSRYALPGVTNQFSFYVIHAGSFRGQCTQLCGLYHSLMIFQVKAVSPSAYEAWLAQNSTSASTTAYHANSSTVQGGSS